MMAVAALDLCGPGPTEPIVAALPLAELLAVTRNASAASFTTAARRITLRDEVPAWTAN
jgi:hypothetical protein